MFLSEVCDVAFDQVAGIPGDRQHGHAKSRQWSVDHSEAAPCQGPLFRRRVRALKPNIVNFLEGFVAPFLVWQAYYDAHQKPPSWGERSHFADGIIEYYAELLGMNKYPSVVGFMRLLARKNRPKGHEICPCGSGERLRNCHRELLYSIREQVDWEYVAVDLLTVLRDDRSKF